MCTGFGTFLTQEVIVKTLTRPVDVVEPPAEGDWQIEACEAGDDE